MSIVALESFDHYADLQDLRQSRVFIPSSSDFDGFVPGRLGGRALQFSPGSLSSDPTYIGLANATSDLTFGYAFRQDGLGQEDPLGVKFTRSGVTQLIMSIDPFDLKISVRKGDLTSLGVSNFRLVPFRWYYIEFQATIGPSGSFEVRVDNETVLSASTVATQSAGDSFVDKVSFSRAFETGFSVANGSSVDDLYIIDNNGGGQTGFLGDVNVSDLLPDGDSAVQWSPNPGPGNYVNVDDGAVNDLASYNESSVTGEQDVYTMQDLSAVPRTVYAVQPVALIQKVDAGPRTFKLGVEDASGDTQDLSSELNLSTEWVYIPRVLESDPDGVAWTNATVNAAKFVVEVAG